MNILMISYWDFQPHGMQVTLRTPLHFARKGHKVVFLVHGERTAESCELTDIHPNLKVVRFKLPFRFTNSTTSKLNRARQFILFFVLCVWHVLKNYRGAAAPDIIYAAEADAVLIGAFLKRILRVPFITRFYGVLRIAGYYDEQAKRLRYLGLRHAISRLAMTRKADMIIVTDDGSNGKRVIQAVNPHADNIKFWRNGIDRVEPDRREVREMRRALGFEEGNVVLLTVCRLDHPKRVDRAIRALEEIHRHRGQNGASSGVRLLVVGDGPERGNCTELAKTLGVEQVVRFAGRVPHDEVRKYYALSDVFLSLYDHTNVGNPLLESLDCGCCVVTLDNGATREVVVDGVNGRLVAVDGEQTTTRRVANVVRELVERPDLRRALADGARAYAESNLWTWEERLQAELDALIELVRSQRRGCRTGGSPMRSGSKR